ncbi:MAG: hypothetical protein H0X04_10700 [Chthoniobacterales bacterium]|nr:hypothetical protein [Chthoniobacterales bacterium]
MLFGGDETSLNARALANATGLRVFFGFLLMLVLSAGFYAFRHRKQFFGYRASEGDTYASATLRMWLVILVWIHAVVITALMIFEV